MADEIDMTQEREENFMRFKLAERRPAGPPAIGQCYNCGEEVPEGHRWCNAECREDWELRQRREV